MRPSTQIATILGFIGLVGVTVIGAVILEITNHDASRIIAYALAVVPILLVQLYQGNEQAKESDNIKSAVNGKLTAQLDSIKDHVSTEVDRVKK